MATLKCHCGEAARSFESKKPQSFGQRFWKCHRSGSTTECSFFVWDSNADAERRLQSQSPRTPRTQEYPHRPPRTTQLNDTPIRAPEWNADGAGRHTPPSSPTSTLASPSQRRTTVAGESQRLGTSLSDEILALLEAEHVDLKTSTVRRLQELIVARTGDYETRIQRYKNGLADLMAV